MAVAARQSEEPEPALRIRSSAPETIRTEDDEARAWLARQLRWERRLNDLRKAEVGGDGPRRAMPSS